MASLPLINHHHHFNLLCALQHTTPNTREVFSGFPSSLAPLPHSLITHQYPNIQSTAPKTPKVFNGYQSTAYEETAELKQSPEDYQGNFEAWRLGVETNTLRSWKVVPPECVEYVKRYMVGSGSQYVRDSNMVANESIAYLNSLHLSGDGKDAWVFDVDETLISSLPFFAAHNFGGEVIDADTFTMTWLERAAAPALPASYRLYTRLLELGFKIFILTGRYHHQRNATERNLVRAGYHSWDALFLREPEDYGTSAKGPGNLMLAADSVQFAAWISGKGAAGLPPATRLILQCVAVAVSRCQGISGHANILPCLVVSLLIESFPLQDIYSSKIMSFPEVSAIGEMKELGKHISSILFKEAGAITRAMCSQYCSASRDLKKLVQHLMWEFSQALYGKHRIFMIRLNSCQQMEDRNRKYHETMEKITEAAFFMLVMFLSVATKNDFSASSSDIQEQLSVITLDALSCVECFRHMQLQEYSDMVKHTVSCVSKVPQPVLLLFIGCPLMTT